MGIFLDLHGLRIDLEILGGTGQISHGISFRSALFRSRVVRRRLGIVNLARLKAMKNGKNRPTPYHSNNSRPDPTGADGHSHGGGYPDAGRRRQSLDTMLMFQLENGSGAQET